MIIHFAEFRHIKYNYFYNKIVSIDYYGNINITRTNHKKADVKMSVITKNYKFY